MRCGALIHGSIHAVWAKEHATVECALTPDMTQEAAALVTDVHAYTPGLRVRRPKEPALRAVLDHLGRRFSFSDLSRVMLMAEPEAISLACDCWDGRP